MGERPSPGERGAALMTVLLLVAVMSVVAAGALDRVTIAGRLAGNAGALDQARAYSMAGEMLAGARIADLVGADQARTTLRGNWNGQTFALPIPAGTGSARVADGGNCFNLNSVVSGAEGKLAARPIGIGQFGALMVLLGVDPREATGIAAATADWIDTDDAPQPGGAESYVYLAGPVPYRTANTLMADPSELRAVRGVSPQIYSVLRPWLCALPVSDLSPINVNTLLPSQAPLFAMLIPGQLPIAQARELIERRPPDGYGNTSQFWSAPALAGLSPNAEVSAQAVLKTRWFKVRSTIELAGAVVEETALYDASVSPARLVRRKWGEDG